MKQDDMQRQPQVLLNDQRQTAAGRRITGITTTNTITTTHKDGGAPAVSRFSQRLYSESSQTCICLAVILMQLINFLDGLYL